MDKLYNLDLRKYPGRITLIQFDPHIDAYEVLEDNVLKANLLKPKVWNSVIKIADGMVKESDLGTLVFASALNLLLFSPTYKSDVIKNLTEMTKTRRISFL